MQKRALSRFTMSLVEPTDLQPRLGIQTRAGTGSGDEAESSTAQNANPQGSNFASAFHYAAIGMALVSLEGRFLQVNRALCELTGYDEAELLSLTFQDITHPDDLHTDLTFLSQLLHGEIPSYRMEKRYFHRQGQLIWILLSVSLVRDSQGQPCHFISQIQDITERKQMEAQLRESQRELKSLVENVPDIIVRYDTDLRVLFVNSYLERVSGRRSDEFVGRTLEEARAPASVSQAHREALAQVMVTREAALTEYHYLSPAGPLHFQMRMVPEFDRQNQEQHQGQRAVTSVLCVSHDVTHLREAQSQLESVQKLLENTNAALSKQNDELGILAFNDSLTGLKNRRALDARLGEEVARAQRQGVPFCLVLLDIDHFKSFNDRFGHSVGDQTLQQVARLLELTLRPSDVVARYGGEEFALIFTHTDSSGSVMAAQRCRRAIESFAWPHSAVTLSMGIASWAGQDPQELLVRADLALYEAKQAGRNCVRLYERKPEALD
jgi:diguanylate cyclase (GGDEF)-like protein/PAS domain S-box-containing protein